MKEYFQIFTTLQCNLLDVHLEALNSINIHRIVGLTFQKPRVGNLQYIVYVGFSF